MLVRANRVRPLQLIPLAALVMGPATPLESRTVSHARHGPAYSPVRCNRDVKDLRAAGGGLRIRQAPVYPQLPAPPPPPSVIASQEIAVTAAKANGPYQTAPVSISPVGPPQDEGRERYAGKDVSGIFAVAQQPVSTFSVDVDTGSYANVRRFLVRGQTPPVAAVRTEEMLNYFRYGYPLPDDRSRPFSVSTDLAVTPWNPDTRVLRIGIRGYDLKREQRPAANLVFLVDVSGSMYDDDKLPLVKSALSLLADRLSPRDRVSIVVYAGAAGIVLEPTSNASDVKAALECLEAGGSTAGGQGMELAYATAREHFIKGGVNRVIMATDGDFNVGISSDDGIEAIVRKNREAGITLTTLGFGQGNYNEAMMERVADVGNGNYAYIDSIIEAQKVLDEEIAATLFTIAKDVKIQIEFNPSQIKEYRLIGYENRALAEEDFDNDRVDAGEIGSGHQVTALYELVPANAKGWLPARHFEGNRNSSGAPVGKADLAWLKLRYKLPDGDESRLIEQPVPAPLASAARLPQGDMAFACAVAAFGQKLRGDKYLGAFSFADIRQLAGRQNGDQREEFLKLASLADSNTAAPQH